jgi:hypothetical protein
VAAPASLPVRLEQAADALVGLNQQTEEQFLEVARNLGDFLARIQRITSEMSTLTELVSGGESDHTAQTLKSALDESRQMLSQAQEANHALAGLQQAAGRLSRSFSELESTESGFQTIATLTRVETARLGNAGSDFGNLADEVRELGGNIQSGVGRAVETVNQLAHSIRETLHNAVEDEDRNSRDLPAVIADIVKALDSIREGRRRAEEAAVRLHCQYEEVSQSVQELILSIQFQDITRQQVEHVIEAVRSLVGAGGREPGMPPTAGAVLNLQCAQLSAAGTTFAASVAQVDRNLERIGSRVAQMTQESTEFMGRFEREQKSYFVEMEQGCTAILGAIRACSVTEVRLHDAAARLTGSIGKVRSIVEEVRGIDLRMHRLSLNASVRATQLGEVGNPLGVLAGALLNLASASDGPSAAAEELLASMQSSAAVLSAGGSAAVDAHAEMLRELRAAIETMHSSTERSFARIQTVQQLGHQLCQDIAVARGNFAPGALFAEVVGGARATLAEGAAGLGTWSEAPGEAARSLEELGNRYTMKAERDVHEAAGVVTLPGPALAPAGSSADDGQDCGGSVELF